MAIVNDVSASEPKRQRLTSVIETVYKAGLILGGLFAAWQYWEAKLDAQIARTIAYVDRFESGSVGQARGEIREELLPYMSQFREVTAAGISDQDRDELVLSIAEANDSRIARNLDHVVDFFQGLNICVEEGLCDRRVAMAYFQTSDARDLWTNFEPYVRLRRENNPLYGREFERYASGASE